MIIEYSKDGSVISDWEVENYVLECFKNKKDIKTSTESVIHMARALINEGIINNIDCKFLFENLEVTCDKNGRIEKWPAGFCDHFEKTLTRLLIPGTIK